MPDLPHLASRLIGTPLMIARPKLDVILRALGPRLLGTGACCRWSNRADGTGTGGDTRGHRRGPGGGHAGRPLGLARCRQRAHQLPGAGSRDRRHPGIRTEAITHARQPTSSGCCERAARARSRSSSTCSGRRRQGAARAGLSNRVHLPRPEALAEYWRAGRDIIPRVVEWIAEGLIDSISGDDVPFGARLVERAGRAG